MVRFAPPHDGGGAGLDVTLPVQSQYSVSFSSLLAQADPRLTIDTEVLHRAVLKYGSSISVAMQERNAALALSLYDRAASLPSTATSRRIHAKYGYIVDGLVHPSSELEICWKEQRRYVLKGLDARESTRAHVFLDALGPSASPETSVIPGITYFHLIDPVAPAQLEQQPGSARGSGIAGSRRVSKHYMVMPMYATALEPLPFLDVQGSSDLWEQMKGALNAIHARGFAHMDIKPSNSESTNCAD